MKLISLVILVLFLTCTDNSNSGSVTLEHLGKDTSIIIRTKKKYPTTLKIHITGTASDTFRISDFKIPGGAVDTFWHNDWYNSDVILNFKSYKAKRGKLKIGYKLY